MTGRPSTPEEVFADSPVGLEVHRRLQELVSDLGVEFRVTRSQVALRNRTGFAYLWCPGRYLKSQVPAVLSIALPERLESSRFKQVGCPSPGVWMHHLELSGPKDLDEEVMTWLRAAYDAAG